MSIKEIENAVDYAYGLLNQKTITRDLLSGEVRLENTPASREDLATVKECLRDILGMLVSIRG